MALSGLGLFLLEACAGTAFLLLFFPPESLGRGFFSLHGSLAAIFAGLALMVRPPGLPLPVLAAATALLALYTLAAHAGQAGAGPAAPRGGAACAAWSPRPGWPSWRPARGRRRLDGGRRARRRALLRRGARDHEPRALVPGFPLDPVRAPGARGGASSRGWRFSGRVYLGVAMAAQRHSEGVQTLLSLERDALFFLFRVLWGIAGPLALSYFIWRTAELQVEPGGDRASLRRPDLRPDRRAALLLPDGRHGIPGVARVDAGPLLLPGLSDGEGARRGSRARSPAGSASEPTRRPSTRCSAPRASSVCAFCGNHAFFLQKDFDQRLGCLIMAASARRWRCSWAGRPAGSGSRRCSSSRWSWTGSSRRASGR